MSIKLKRATFDILTKDYKTNRPKVELWDPGSFDRPLNDGERVQRWYLSLSGESAPLASPNVTAKTEASGARDARLENELTTFRYDWTFGITLLGQEPYWWDWVADLRATSSIAIHLIISPSSEAPEARPLAATLNTLHPSRNNESFFERQGQAVAKGLQGAAGLSGLIPTTSGVPLGTLLRQTLLTTSDLLDSKTDNRTNWFMYQFLDSGLNCPTVEWRIHKRVIMEYGPLLRGSVFLSFAPGAPPAGTIRLTLRPQLGYYAKDDICFVTAPAHERHDVSIDVSF